MKKEYSLIDLRLIELRRHYLNKIITISFLAALLAFIISALFTFPTFTNVFYKDFMLEKFHFLYIDNIKIQTTLNFLVYGISILVCVLLTLILCFYSNKKFHRLYISILFNELQLNEYAINNRIDIISTNMMDQIYNYINLDVIVNEKILSLKKENYLNIYQLDLRNPNMKKGALFLIKGKHRFTDFIQFNTLNKKVISTYEEKNVFDFHYDSPKYPALINVFSSYGKMTNKICSNECLKIINDLQIYLHSKIILTSFNDYIALFIPNWKIVISESLYKEVEPDTIDKKIETIEKIHNYLTEIEKILSKKGEK